MNIIQRLIPKSDTKHRPGTRMTPKYITIHETDNEAARANAEAHARLQEGGKNDRTASWHLQVDDTYAIQSIPFNEIAWAAGDGAHGPGNTTSIHLEICVNKDGDFLKAVKNAAEVTKHLMDTFHIPLDHVVQHNKWSGKNCPRHLRAGDWGVKWADFLGLLKDKPKASGQIGVVTVTASTLNVRKNPDISAPVVKQVKKGEAYKAYTVKNGWYNVGPGWVSGKYVTFKGV